MDDNKNNKNTNIQREIFDWVETLIKPIVALVLVFTFILASAQVNGQSMENTLYGGENFSTKGSDRLFISNLWYTPERSDIVVISRNATSDPLHNYDGNQSTIVKRVIGVEGDVIDITEDGVVTVNGEVIDEPYIKDQNFDYVDEQTYPLTVEPGKIFVMGDNRNNSLDSRYNQIGQVDVQYVKGKAVFRFFPFKKIGFV